MRIATLCGFLLVLGGGGALRSQQKANAEFGAIEDRCRAAASRAVASTVFVWNGAGGSGVLISKDGWILTAAHVLKRPAGRLQVRLHDGRIASARIMGRLPEHDAAVLKLRGKGPWPFSPLAPAGSFKKGDLCLATGVPLGILRHRPAPLRLGTALDVERDFLRTSCTLDQGDSGGPLFDLQGRVVGVHSRIGYQLSMNYHVSSDLFRDRWSELTKGQIHKEAAAEDGRFRRSPLHNPGQPWRRSPAVLNQAKLRSFALLRAIVEVECAAGKKILGTVLREDGWVVTKNSAARKPRRCRLHGGKRVQILRVLRDVSADLAFLKLDTEGLSALSPARDSHYPQGRILLTPRPHSATVIGILSVPPRSIPRLRVRLGARLKKAEGGGARILKITEGSCSHRARLAVGDVITSIAGVPVAVPSDLRQELAKVDPGTRIRLGFTRGGKAMNTILRVGSTRDVKAWRRGVRSQPDAVRGLVFSSRRSGFSLVFQHDSVLQAKDCGGPILDRAGRFIGLNIARASRRASYAIPAEEVARLFAKALER